MTRRHSNHTRSDEHRSEEAIQAEARSERAVHEALLAGRIGEGLAPSSDPSPAAEVPENPPPAECISQHEPGHLDAIRLAQQEVLDMQVAADAVTAGFQFEQAALAIRERQTLHRRYGAVMIAYLGALAVVGGVVWWLRGGSHALAVSVVPASPLILWWMLNSLAARRERRLLERKGDAVLVELFEASQRRVLQEFEVVRACVVLVALGLVVLIADSLFRGATIKGTVAILSLSVVLLIVLPRFFGKRAKRRAELFASGRLSADAFARNEPCDEDDEAGCA